MNNKEKRKLSISSIIKAIFFIICIILLLMGMSIIYKANKYPDKVPDVFGIKPFIVLSGSMETEIYTGDLAFVKIIEPKELKQNDVIAFRNAENTVTTHRIIEIIEENGQTFYKTKGDANNTEDASLVSTDEVEGIYIGKISKLGNMLMFLQEPIGLVIVLLVILVIGMIWLYATNKSDMKKVIAEDEKYRKEFEEFKRKKQIEEQTGTQKEKVHK